MKTLPIPPHAFSHPRARPVRRAAAPALLALLALAPTLAGCASDAQQPRAHARGPGSSPTPVVTPNVPVTLDGNIEEWPAEAALLADDHYIYFRISIQGTQWTLQSGPQTLAMLIDLDASTTTGHVGPAPADQLGVDVEIQFTPLAADGTRQNGVAVFAVDRAGKRTPIPNDQADVSFLPTYASTWYEGRLSRRLPLSAAAAPLAETPMTGMGVLYSEDGEVEGWSDPSTVIAPPAAGLPALGAFDTSLDLPAKPMGSIRLLTWNVLRNGPVSKPEPYARVIQAANPDVVLLQEWEQGDADDLTSWFTAMVPGSNAWHAVKGYGGVAIVSRFPLDPIELDEPTTTTAGRTSQVRVIAATAATPAGELAVASTHLKCCGHKDSPEDRLRMDQARAINKALAAAHPTAPGLRILGGDLNLVGSRPPIDLLRSGLDADGSDLSVAEPFVLGDRTQYTWADDKTRFTPGRLDYVLYSDSTAQVYQSFVLDTTRLNEELLARAGLDRTDTDVSDHKPVVVDLMPVAK